MRPREEEEQEEPDPDCNREQGPPSHCTLERVWSVEEVSEVEEVSAGCARALARW